MKDKSAPAKTMAERLSRWRFILEYAVPSALVLILLYKILGSAAWGDAPMPQTPPDGYTASESRVLLGWTRGDVRGELRVQLMEGDRFGDLDEGKPVKLLVNKRTEATTARTPKLEGDKRYCWRVTDGGGGSVYCFDTSTSYVAY